MQVIGILDDHSVFSSTLEHGASLDGVVADHGFVLVRPLEALRGARGVLELRVAVRPAQEVSGHAPDHGHQHDRSQDVDLDLTSVSSIELRQRVAAYVLVTSDLGLLATEFSDRTSVPGRWGLPGGGLDENEEPTTAVLREVAEETEQQIELGDLVQVQTSHWVGLSPRGTVEDYHAVRLIYEGRCPQPTPAVVVDVGGTTESARWVPVEQWRTLNWTSGWHRFLSTRLP